MYIKSEIRSISGKEHLNIPFPQHMGHSGVPRHGCPVFFSQSQAHVPRTPGPGPPCTMLFVLVMFPINLRAATRLCQRVGVGHGPDIRHIRVGHKTFAHLQIRPGIVSPRAPIRKVDGRDTSGDLEQGRENFGRFWVKRRVLGCDKRTIRHN